MSKIIRPILEEIQPVFYLEIAKKIEKRVKTFRKEDTDGIYWVTGEDNQTNFNHYSGSAGIIRFYLELYGATNDTEYLQEAILGANNLVQHHTLKASSYLDDDFNEKKFLTMSTAFTQAEIADVLLLLNDVTNNPTYLEFAKEIFDSIVEQASVSADGITWSGLPDIGADSGVIVLLLKAATVFNNEKYKEVAIKGAELLLATEIKEEKGSRYPGKVDLIHLLPKEDKDSKFPTDLFKGDFFPNFSHGVSGVSYGFLKVYQETKDERFLQAAIRGATLIQNISVPAGNGKLVPYLYPNNRENIFYLSYCHGPAGTARLFYELYKVTGEKQYLEFYDILFKGVEATGAPELHSTGYWINHCQCCGSAGLLHAFNGSYLATGNRRYLDLAKRTAKAITSEGYEDDEGLVHWYQHWTRSDPENRGEYLGYGIGDVGLASAFIELYGILNNGFIPVRTYDDPFPRKKEVITWD